MADVLASERFAAHVAGVQLRDLPGAAVLAAKTFILDTLGVGVAGSTAAGAEQLLHAARGWGQGNQAAVWGRRDRLPAASVALLNAFQVHCQEYDCVHEGAVLHPMAALLPAALAAAERRGGVSGAELLVAVAVGCDVSAGLGVATHSGLRFFRPATSGGFGAVAAVARLLGLDAAAVQSAFGLQYAQASGTMQAHVEGNVALPMQVGFNSRAAICAADLAAAGLVGPADVFEGPYGYMRLFEGEWDLAPVLDSLGQAWRVAELSHKPYPAGRATHGGIEAVTEVLQTCAAHDIAEIVVEGPPVIQRLCGRVPFAGMSPNFARLSTGFAIANVLRHGMLDLSHYRGDALHDPATIALAQKVRVTVSDITNPNALGPQHVTIRLNDGTVRDWRCDTMLASPQRPLTREQHLQKFHRCWRFAADTLGPADALIDLVDQLEALPDVSVLTAALQP
jgi:2-methylcitrate dehydratase PrpD